MTDEFELTRSPQFNEVIQLGRDVIDGVGNAADFKKSLKKLNYLRRDMRRLLRYGFKFQEKTPLLLSESAKIEENLKKLKEGIEETYRYFKNNDTRHILRGFKICRTTFEALFHSFDALKEEEEKRTPFSESPYQDELMRVGYGVMKGKIKPEAFRERLEMMKVFVKNFYDHFDTMEPNSYEREYYEQNMSAIKNALKAYRKALDEASYYFKDGDLYHIEKGLKMSKEASDELIIHQKELTKASEGPKVKICFRCGYENNMTSKFCTSCNAVLHVFGPELESTIELQMDREGTVKDFRHIRTQYTEKLVEAVSKVKEGSISNDAFAAILTELEQKALHAQREKAMLRVPEELLQADNAEFFEGVEQMMNTGIEEILEGIELLRRFLADRDETHLSFGLDTALSGTDKLYQVKLLSDEIRKHADKTPERS